MDPAERQRKRSIVLLAFAALLASYSALKLHGWFAFVAGAVAGIALVLCVARLARRT